MNSRILNSRIVNSRILNSRIVNSRIHKMVFEKRIFVIILKRIPAGSFFDILNVTDRSRTCATGACTAGGIK